MDALLAAIINDDRPRAKQLLKAEAELARGLIDKPRLVESKIFHWIYVGDTALHLAAAGYRVELVQLLLATGADPNATTNHRRSGPGQTSMRRTKTGPRPCTARSVRAVPPR